MHQKLFGLIFLLACSLQTQAQISGRVMNTQQEGLAQVNIFIENSYQGSVSNQSGYFELPVANSDSLTLVFRFLGYKTLKQKIIMNAPQYDCGTIVLEEEPTSLDQIVLNNQQNKGLSLIKKAIANREKNLNLTKSYTANFYSKGIWKIQNAPEKILGNDLSDLRSKLDSTGSGIAYLSETVSQIKFQAPDNFHEKIIASKLSGDDNGFSFNSAQEAEFNFYKNNIDMRQNLISPIADYALNHYNYQLTDLFYDEQNHLIYKIQVQPKNPKGRIFSGFVYLVDDTWQLYGVDLQTTGEAIQFEAIETIDFKQNFSFNPVDQRWVKQTQTIDFSWSILGVSGDGRFSAVYTNYNFNPQFTSASFGREILAFDTKANDKDSMFWQGQRPIPLTNEEQQDYLEKQKLASLQSSKHYQDSIDAQNNRFKIGNLISGYTYKQSYKNQRWQVEAPLKNLHFNLVQGYNLRLPLRFVKTEPKNNTFYSFAATPQYGFSDKTWRGSFTYTQKFNNFSKPFLSISLGSEAKEINNKSSTPLHLYDLALIGFQENYLKLYANQFARISYSNELTNGLRFYSALSYNKRDVLKNKARHGFFKSSSQFYTPNNPLDSNNRPASALFTPHQMLQYEIGLRIDFDQSYYLYPDGKYAVSSSKYPRLFLYYNQGWATDLGTYNFSKISLRVNQNLSWQQRGTFSYFARGGFFIGRDKTSFIDYQHFDSTPTQIRLKPGLDRFYLLDLYSHSTADTFAEVHVQQDFKGWLLGKLPGIQALNLNFVATAKALYTQEHNPFIEVGLGLDNLGWGKYRILRLDFVKSLHPSNQNDFGIFVGLSL